MNNKQSPFAIHNLNPGLVTEVNDAYQRNVEAGRVVSDEFTEGVAVESLVDVLRGGSAAEDAERASSNEVLTGEIINRETLASFETAFHDAMVLFDRIGIHVPLPEDFYAVGVEFRVLAERYEAMQQSGLEPQIVIAPHRDSCDMWMDLYDELYKDYNLSWGYRRTGDDIGTSIDISPEVREGWKMINTSYLSFTNLYKFRDGAEDAMFENSTDWSVRLISTSPKKDHQDNRYYASGGIHPTIAEYLTLQAVRIQSDQQLMGGNEILWLDGKVGGANSVPVGYAGVSRKKIYIETHDKNYTEHNYVVRRPVWK